MRRIGALAGPRGTPGESVPERSNRWSAITSWRRRWRVGPVALGLAMAACKQKAKPTTPASDSTASAPSVAPVAGPPSTPGAHAADPHTLSDAELRYGVSPTRSDKVTYNDDVVVMEHGAEAIRGVSSDGMSVSFDASSPQVADIQPGKIILASSRAAGRVLGVTQSGGTVTAILGPVELTDVIKDADLSYDQPIDMDQMLAYTAADYPGTVSEMGKLTSDADDGRGDGTSVTAAVLSPTGEATPVTFVSRRAPSSGPSLTAADLARFRIMQGSSVPQLPPGIGPPGSTNLGDFKAFPFCTCGGLGLKVVHSGDDINVLVTAVLHLTSPKLHFDLKISHAQIKTALIRLDGAAGITMHFEAATPAGLSGNVNKKFFVPVDFTIPILGMPVPFAVTLHQQFLLQTAFTAKNSALSADGDYSMSGQIYMGYDHGGWSVGAPTSLHKNTSLGESMKGASLGVTGIVFSLEGRVIVGIGAFGFATGPYLGYQTTIGITRGSDQVTGLIGTTCRGQIINLSLNVGVGYQVNSTLTKAINALLATLNAGPIQGSGGLQHSENLLHLPQDDPHGCAYGSS